MNTLALIAALQEPEAGGGGLFSINTGVMIWTVIIFVTLLLVLGKWAWGPILGALNERERRIQEMIDAAARERQEAETLLAEHRRQLAESRQQSQQIIAEGKQAAERVRQELLERTRREQEEMLARAKEDLGRERDRALEALRREAVELSLAAASKLVRRRLSAEEDRRLVREYLAEVAPDTGTGAA
ncbi:MAG: F0F1 ATP synthase subunit B [Longimicrobiales bacterium]